MKPLNQMTPQDFLVLAKSIDKKTWTMIGAGAAGALLLTYFLVWPAWIKRPMVKTQIAAVQGQIIQLQTLRRKKTVWTQEKEASEKFIKDVKGRLYFPGETSLLLGKIARLADESQIKIVSSSPQEVKTDFPKPFDAKYKADYFDFTVEGGYHQIADFISRVESYDKILRVEDFTITPEEDTPEKHMVHLTLSAVSLQEPQAAAAAGT
ncbi:MAG TPA: type 4a pilus biogenesis protein PilO [Verrucomicrobiae bacterium]|jgi:Tfp pilus assembly protein PilO|nr:type 4a pilus biogenesis protein PilO [Verrucomicrobiae bacterium]